MKFALLAGSVVDVATSSKWVIGQMASLRRLFKT